MVRVQSSGFYSSIQDRGRFGFRHFGVPVAGTMDAYSASIANSLLENDEADALMEITMTGPTLQFGSPTYIAITGAFMTPQINGKDISQNRVQKVVAGDTLSFGKLGYGLRTYLAVKGGFLTEKYMESRSFLKPISPENRLKDLMELPLAEVKDFSPIISDISPEPFHKQQQLKVFKGPEYNLLNDRQLEALFSKDFTVAKENNRMAYQLSETIPGHTQTMLTSSTIPGTVQLTPAGKIIILMKDGQTTGGYPRILQLAEDSISVLAQKKYGDILSFQLR